MTNEDGFDHEIWDAADFEFTPPEQPAPEQPATDDDLPALPSLAEVVEYLTNEVAPFLMTTPATEKECPTVEKLLLAGLVHLNPGIISAGKVTWYDNFVMGHADLHHLAHILYRMAYYRGLEEGKRGQADS